MKTKMRVLLMSLCAAFIMLAGSGVTVHAEGFSVEGPFGYAYDVQRDPYPEEAGGTIGCRRLSEPYLSPAERNETVTGNWTLTQLGAYADVVKTIDNSSNLYLVVRDVSDRYSDLPFSDVCIHELKDGDRHIAYGVIVVSDETDKVVFIGDSLGGGAGYLLSVDEVTTLDSIEITAAKIAPDYAVSTLKKVLELDVTDSYTFDSAEEGYAAVAPREVTVKNISDVETGELQILMEGLTANYFELSKTTIASLAPGASDTFTVVPKDGSTVGIYKASIGVKAAEGNTLNIKPETFDVYFTVTEAQTPEPTPTPEEPTPAPAEPTPTPEEPTPAPVEPTPTPEVPTPTPVPAEPTPTPEVTPAPTETPAPADNDSSDDDDDDEVVQETVVATPAPEVLYTVQKGDNLWMIARKNGCTLEELMVANADLLHFRSLIYPNWVLRIPQNNILTVAAAQSAPAVESTQLYKVQKGDSLWKIARNNKCSVDEIMNLNNIAADHADLIYPGWDLSLPTK